MKINNTSLCGLYWIYGGGHDKSEMAPGYRRKAKEGNQNEAEIIDGFN